MDKTVVLFLGLCGLVWAGLCGSSALAALPELVLAQGSTTQEGVACSEALSTYEINQCAANELDLAEQALMRQLDRVYSLYSADRQLVESIKLAQQSWQAYLASHCDSIYMKWRGGTIRGLMGIHCKTQLTRQRSRELWLNFLNNLDAKAQPPGH